MKRIILSLSVALVATCLTAQEKHYPDIDIPYKKFTLSNGLTLIVHEDHKVPIVALNVWYHVGSKNEKPGKTGFAHLFEHLMFNGSANFNDDYFKLMERIGATGLNGTTNEDRTNYFENVPKNAVDIAMWAESDRMGHMVEVIDKAKVDEQRGVVQNEKRQDENQPYAVVDELMPKNTYPANHPYSWSVIGSMEDLNAASIEDVKDWFRSYYGPNNAVLVVAGDITADEAFEKVKKYFGDIPAVPPISRQQAWVARGTGTHRMAIQDRVPQARLMMAWNVPQWGTKEVAYLNLLSRVLTSSGKTARLYKRLVYDDQLVSSVSTFVDKREISSQFYVQADAKPGVSLRKIEKIINEEMERLMNDGPTEVELERAKTQYFAGMIKGMERIGGFGGKSDILAENATYGGTPDYYKKNDNWIKKATPQDLQKVMRDWLTDGDIVLEITPYETFKEEPKKLDRKTVPLADKMSNMSFPTVQRTTLSNGMKVWLVERHATPVVYMDMLVGAGNAQNKTPGTAILTTTMLREGTATRNSIQISSELTDLGASFYAGASKDNSDIIMNALKVNYDKSLDLYSDILLHPSFPEKDFARIKSQQLLAIKQEQAEPFGMGMRIIPKIIYGADHAYSAPGSGTDASINKLTTDDLKNYYSTWFAPNNAIMLVVGDISIDELKGKLEARLGEWKKKDIPVTNLKDAAIATKPNIYIIDKPGAGQSIIYAAHLGSKGNDLDWDKYSMMNRPLGGEFTSRINMNLREDKHWSYGAGSFFSRAKGQGMFMAYAPVQTDKTKESMMEMKKELDQFVGSKPITEAEFTKVQKNAVMQLPGAWETNDGISGYLSKVAEYDLGDGYLNNYTQMINNMKLEDMRAVARKSIQPSALTWVVVGDRSKIEQGIKSLNWGNVIYLDSDGNPVN
ncbi:MAG: insulinase family protein [Taibaiella sp.]|nr:insulinase family protein [Taibaiella sp.]